MIKILVLFLIAQFFYSFKYNSCLVEVNNQLQNFRNLYDNIVENLFDIDSNTMDKFILGFKGIFQECFGVEKDFKNLALCANNFLPLLKEMKIAQQNTNQNQQDFYAITLTRILMQSNQSFGNCKKNLNLIY